MFFHGPHNTLLCSLPEWSSGWHPLQKAPALPTSNHSPNLQSPALHLLVLALSQFLTQNPQSRSFLAFVFSLIHSLKPCILHCGLWKACPSITVLSSWSDKKALFALAFFSYAQCPLLGSTLKVPGLITNSPPIYISQWVRKMK